MRNFQQFIGRELTWKQRHALIAREYEMRDGDVDVAELVFRSAFGTLASGACADGNWTFKRVGFLRPHITVRSLGSQDNIAIFESRTLEDGGIIWRTGSENYRAGSDQKVATYKITNLREEPLVRFKNAFGIVLKKHLLTIEPAADNNPDLPWLVLLGWYLVIMLSVHTERREYGP